MALTPVGKLRYKMYRLSCRAPQTCVGRWKSLQMYSAPPPRWRRIVSGMRLLTADEGGLAPAFASSEAMLQAAVDAITAAGFPTWNRCRADGGCGRLAVSCRRALSQLDGESLERAQMVDLLDQWARDYPLISIEDGLDEADWTGWQLLYKRLAGEVLILGDDLLCTNPARIQRAIATDAANSLLLKVNQIGTVTEALEAYRLAKRAGWQVVVSARSGETEDDWLADLAAGWAGDYIKVGSITQSERLAKYNRLLMLEATTDLQLTNPPTAR